MIVSQINMQVLRMEQKKPAPRKILRPQALKANDHSDQPKKAS